MGTRMRDGMKTGKIAKKGKNVRQHSKKKRGKDLGQLIKPAGEGGVRTTK